MWYQIEYFPRANFYSVTLKKIQHLVNSSESANKMYLSISTHIKRLLFSSDSSASATTPDPTFIDFPEAEVEVLTTFLTPITCSMSL